MAVRLLKYNGPPVFGYKDSPTTKMRRVLFDISFNIYYHSLGTPVGGQFSYIY